MATWTNPRVPNVVDFTTFLRQMLTTDVVLLPDSSPFIPMALGVAQQIVTSALSVGDCVPSGADFLTVYCLAVYNFATDRLVNFAQDAPGQTYFADMREKLGLLSVSTGLAQNVSDSGTSAGLLNQEQMRLFTLQELQTMKTPWGRTYNSLAQKNGVTLYGLT